MACNVSAILSAIFEFHIIKGYVFLHFQGPYWSTQHCKMPDVELPIHFTQGWAHLNTLRLRLHISTWLCSTTCATCACISPSDCACISQPRRVVKNLCYLCLYISAWSCSTTCTTCRTCTTLATLATCATFACLSQSGSGTARRVSVTSTTAALFAWTNRVLNISE